MELTEKEYFMELVREGTLKKVQMKNSALLIPASFIFADLGTNPLECKYAGVITNRRPGKYPDAPMFYFFYKEESDIWKDGFEEHVWEKCREVSPEFDSLITLTLSHLKSGQEFGDNLALPAWGIHPIDDFTFYHEQRKYDPNYKMPYDAIIMN